jgi:hypothetical protein
MMPACDADVSTAQPWRMPSSGGDCSPSLPDHPLPIAPTARLDPLESSTTLKWRSSCRQLLFPGLWLLIGLVSAFDAYLTVKFQDSLREHEQNPLARILLRLDGSEPSLLIGSKFLGSLIVLGILTALHLRNRRLGLTVAGGIACFQLGLLWYLVAG